MSVHWQVGDYKEVRRAAEVIDKLDSYRQFV